MRTLLLIMNPRDIPECIDALKALKIDKVWLRAHLQKWLEPVIDKIVNETNYDNYSIISDDAVPTQDALDAVLELAREHEVSSGLCPMSPKSNRFNVSIRRLRASSPSYFSCDYIHAWELARCSEVFPVFFSGFIFTTMRRELWQKFPFRVYPENHLRRGLTINGKPPNGWASDYNLSYRLQSAGVPIYCTKKGLVPHLNLSAYFNIHNEPPSVRYDLLSA